MCNKAYLGCYPYGLIVRAEPESMWSSSLVDLQMKYRLARQGFMKQFEGSWKVDPLYVDAQGSPSSENEADRVASIVSLEQVISSPRFC